MVHLSLRLENRHELGCFAKETVLWHLTQLGVLSSLHTGRQPIKNSAPVKTEKHLPQCLSVLPLNEVVFSHFLLKGIKSIIHVT